MLYTRMSVGINMRELSENIWIRKIGRPSLKRKGVNCFSFFSPRISTFLFSQLPPRLIKPRRINPSSKQESRAHYGCIYSNLHNRKNKANSWTNIRTGMVFMLQLLHSINREHDAQRHQIACLRIHRESKIGSERPVSLGTATS